jgi:Protein of unknown function (DUF995)
MFHRFSFVGRKATVILGLFCLSGAGLPSAALAATVQKSAGTASKNAPGRPMSASELRGMYAGKTWIWSNGGGYMGPGGRFSAAIGKDRATASYARGTWQTNNQGVMCFAGAWRARAGKSQSRSCFAHRVAGSAIYQRKLPSGEWYMFKQSPAQSSDEFSKLVRGDRVSGQMRQAQAALASN